MCATCVCSINANVLTCDVMGYKYVKILEYFSIMLGNGCKWIDVDRKLNKQDLCVCVCMCASVREQPHICQSP